ncbi:hemolysin family protein [Pectinatus frisingensis]|uniref:hemolysin family protein n=1 Tax=Pectinatus frisingensis TaxID=865 RepID=UPI0018C7DED2|nr:hemolysin family protein [Pectinatus frisingensis]
MDVPETDFFLILTVVLLFFNTFLVLLKTALSESHKSQLDEIIPEDDSRFETICDLIDSPDELFSALTICSVCCYFAIGISSGMIIIPCIYSFFQANISFIPYIYEITFVISFILLLFICILLGIVIPNKLAQIRPEYYLTKYLSFLLLFRITIRPLINMMSHIANILLMITGTNPPSADSVTEDEVKDLIERGTEEGTFEKAEQDMVGSIFHMSDQTAYSLMTPRTQINWIDLEDDLSTNLTLIKDSPDDVFLIGRDNLDNLIGIIYAKDILKAAIDNDLHDLEKFIKQPVFIPRSMESFRILEKFRQNNVNEAVVADEYGGVVGFITLKDIIEEIIGDISYPEEKDTAQIIQRDENSWYIDGLYDIDDFKERFDIDELPGEERAQYQTVGGFLLSYFGYIPKAAEYKIWHNLRFEIADMDRNRIDKILVTRLFTD